ncbi:nuclear transport factor 2 family protein [Streptomyces sp. NPDC050504]|uniref:nuclear transport factor 2 family protein n=1 Tax=Streptomyces sp. NPDC050504 TaxID=3365618 RepID=UPI003799BA4F
MQPADTVRAWVDANNAYDFESLHALYAPDAEVVCDQFGIRLNTEPARREMIAGFDAALPGGTFTPSLIVDGGTHVVLEATYEATVAIDDMPGLPAKSELFRLPIAVVFEVREDLIRREQTYCDWPAAD